MTACRSCGSGALETFLSLGAMPLADGLLTADQLDRPEPRYPLDVAFCRDCSLMQILATVSPEELFCRDFPYYSSFSDTLLAHSKANADALVEARRLGPQSLVVELASNDGYLLQYFAARGVPVLGIDPADGPARAARQRGIPTLEAFFGKAMAEELVREGKRADVIIANNVLAHVADTNGFVQGISILLQPHGVAVIEVPYVKDLIDDCKFDTIYHEHLCYFSVTALGALFRRHGLYLNEVEHHPIHGGSLRLFVEPRERAAASVRRWLEMEADAGLTGAAYYAGFAARVDRLKAELLALLRRLRDGGATIAAYGAAAKGTILLNYVGLGRELIEFVVDRNTHKQGRYMPGVRLPIHDPAMLLEAMPSHVLLLSWNFKDEILAQQAEYRRRGGAFVVPIPVPEVVR